MSEYKDYNVNNERDTSKFPLKMKKPKDEDEMIVIKGLKNPDNMDKSKLISHRYKEYR